MHFEASDRFIWLSYFGVSVELGLSAMASRNLQAIPKMGW